VGVRGRIAQGGRSPCAARFAQLPAGPGRTGSHQRLVYRLDDAREGSAEHKMIIRQLVGVRDSSELAGLIIEEFEMRAEVSLPRRTDRR